MTVAGEPLILGIGNDLIDIRRIEATLERFGDRFLERVFTEIERQKSDRRAARAASYAKRFAAKEACAKALGTGLRAGVFWRDMGVINLPSGRPTLLLTGGAAEQLKRITPAGCEARIDLTLTDDFPLAEAVVVISALSDARHRVELRQRPEMAIAAFLEGAQEASEPAELDKGDEPGHQLQGDWRLRLVGDGQDRRSGARYRHGRARLFLPAL